MMLLFFFFKQKTAYEMRISDWSSDVCSSDLGGLRGEFSGTLRWEVFAQYAKTKRTQDFVNDVAYDRLFKAVPVTPGGACVDPSGGCVPANTFGPGHMSEAAAEFIRLAIGIAAGRDSVVWAVVLPGVGGALQNKN